MSFLSQIREQIYNLVPKNSRIIDIGCGRGKLLYELSNKINYGLGIDINKGKINFAKKNVKNNLEFRVESAQKVKGNFDYSIVMFFLHSMNYKTQIKTLENMKKISKQQIIVDYVSPKNIFYRTLISFDEILAAHYKNFLNYRKIGMERLIKESGLKIDKKIKKNFYSIWIC